jgi:uncharacterized heparinase superfamily protein
MLSALGTLARPDERLRCINDSANGESPTLSAVWALARVALGESCTTPVVASLASAGYYVLPEGDDRILFDAGPLGPEHQPGHGHCDTLSIEWDHRDIQVLVDSGCSGYDDMNRRRYERSTAAHNTVRIGDLDQAELWDAFRVARRPIVGTVTVRANGLEAWTSPYHARRSRHRRTINRPAPGRLSVMDTVTGAEGMKSTALFHFHPRWNLAVDGSRVTARVNDAAGWEVCANFAGAASVQLERGDGRAAQGWFAEAFGQSIPAPVVAVELEPGRPLQSTFEVHAK